MAGDVDFNKTVYSSSFVAALNKLLGKNFRLTTRAEWMWAARGGDAATLYSGTSNVDELADYAWYNINEDEFSGLHEVAGKRPNCFGLFDMTGNVSEWCADEGAFNSHPCMGGSVYDDAEICLISRGATYGSLFTIELGFRLVLPI